MKIKFNIDVSVEISGIILIKLTGGSNGSEFSDWWEGLAYRNVFAYD